MENGELGHPFSIVHCPFFIVHCPLFLRCLFGVGLGGILKHLRIGVDAHDVLREEDDIRHFGALIVFSHFTKYLEWLEMMIPLEALTFLPRRS